VLLAGAVVASFFGLLAGLIFEPFMRLIGHPVMNPQPMWLMILCGVVLSVGIAIEHWRRT
jgi:uncharacterized membrane protein YfcA